MSDRQAVLLESRGLLRLEGEDLRDFLQGIVSNDVTHASAERAIWAAFLTPQGKFLHEFFLVESDGALLLDGEAERLADLKRRLTLYKLRSKVTLEEVSADWSVYALIGETALQALGLDAQEGAACAFAGGIAYVDPRLLALGARAILPRLEAAERLAEAGFEAAGLDAYDALRLPLGVPDGSRDLEVEKSILLESGFDELHGVDWDKGCYLGQELTARTKYRALIKKRLLPVVVEGAAPAPDTPILAGGKEVGRMRSTSGGHGLALLRLNALESDQSMTAGEARVTPRMPDWIRIPETSDA